MITPFLKWAGGKRWLVNAGLPRPLRFQRYLEPFLGGAAVFFALQPDQAVLSDVNPELINLYRVIRDEPGRLERILQVHHAMHCEAHYYDVRGWSAVDAVEAAARTLYLNRTCWNGLYRVNRKGEFNVPKGTKSAVIMEDDNFLATSFALKKADIRCCDFEMTVNEAQEGDFLFVDPPYTVKHNMNGFVKYNETIFSWADQVRLRDAIAAAIKRDVAVVVTNADHESLRELYQGLMSYRSAPRSSVLAGPPERRGRTTEALFSANF